ncbi:MAG TPA: O-antigen ligase family protein, partial [Candidatus Paceibacterota bacterium]|nr:O-antigen ligase family protein [Candidatus Paceibacterota bacterium]
FQREEDLFFFTRVMAWVMLWELLVVLKMRYGDGIYRVAGTFEHQNSLVMFSNMVAMVFLALGLDPQGKHRRLYLGAFAGCAIITLLTVSRAGAAFFVLGTLILIGGFTLARPSIRTAALSGLLLVALLFGGLKAMDTFLGRVRAEGTESREDLRAVMNRISWKMAKDHPLGIGWNNWVLAVTPPNEYSADMAQWQMEAGHRVRDDSSYALVESHWFLILSENGFHSLIIFGVFLASFLWQGLRSVMYFKGTHIGSLISGVTVGCLVNYLESFFEHVLAQPRNALLWFIFLAVTARLDWWRRRRVLDRHSILENPANTRGRTTLELPPKMLSPSPIRP